MCKIKKDTLLFWDVKSMQDHSISSDLTSSTIDHLFTGEAANLATSTSTFTSTAWL